MRNLRRYKRPLLNVKFGSVPVNHINDNKTLGFKLFALSSLSCIRETIKDMITKHNGSRYGNGACG